MKCGRVLQFEMKLFVFLIFLVFVPFVLFVPLNLSGPVFASVSAHADPGRIDNWQPAIFSGLFSAGITVGMFDNSPAIVSGCHFGGWLATARALVFGRQIARKHMHLVIFIGK